ncbi:ribosomal protein S18 acetylase RimI-like enzyme [Deinobacterium chartae]|uniref:Ribosomal protein S18 acetylase RimI-like enzyme n=1 Tax=Deinobacterium chartae TaxID=521158 RepID=A0A841HZV6_9DEIO|nr:GNAT family N-acetyltransferase [Deinobacterium chartae]MBB6097412.1 ribosomal protein S18 acetylase RimI-like enzyme [Deinobacterium chartae]
MIRPMRPSDVHDVITLLEWMDGSPDREVFSPEARDLEDLRWECQGKTCLVYQDDLGTVRGYAALSPYKDGFLLEGPLSNRGIVRPLLAELLRSDHRPVYAFVARDNMGVREALEEADFGAIHTTDFFVLPRRAAKLRSRMPEGLRLLPAFSVTFDQYLDLYRSSEDVWSERLSWSEEDYRRHFAKEGTYLLVLARDDEPLGFAELEIDGDEATLSYLAVHPTHRGNGYGHVLLDHAVREGFTPLEVTHLRARAHDHEGVARLLYQKHGFVPERSVVAYLLDG